jgi:hypothetical protein
MPGDKIAGRVRSGWWYDSIFMNIAALTFWYESYYEVCKGGQYFRIIDEMHAKYGQEFHNEPTQKSR